CIYCVVTTHESQDCPQLVCQFCGSRDHTRFGCPTKQRCPQCRQVGHTKESCQEKLKLPKSEQDPCAFCGFGHTEEECSEIWRSFNPLTATRKTVNSIPAFCFICGAEGHYGPEC
ncbi:uncharacterized protein BCR38DRAFT_327253, partial [Pseudomassariella vexata]